MELKKFPGLEGNFLWGMTNWAEAYQATDLSLGSSDFRCPDSLTDLAVHYIQKGYNNYAPTEGILPLRKQISAFIKKQYGFNFDPATEITITPGIVSSISSIISAFIREDEEVIIIDPSYVTFSPVVKLAGGRPVYVSLKSPDFHIDWEEFRKLVNGKTRMIILNTPHNPTGKVFSEDDMLQLQKLTNGTNIIVLSDELFDQLVFDNKKHFSIAGFEKLAARSFIVSSFGPVFNINGWNISWCMAPEELMNKFRRTYMSQVGNVNTPLQYALSEFLESEIDFTEITEFFQGKRNYFIRLMVDSPFKIIPSQGTYFQLIDYSEVSDMEDLDFAYNLLVNAKVATVPLSAFYNQKNRAKQVRICFAKTNEKLEMAAEKLKKSVEIFR